MSRLRRETALLPTPGPGWDASVVQGDPSVPLLVPELPPAIAGFVETALSSPGRVAIDLDGRPYTYGDLLKAAAALLEIMEQSEVDEGDCVAFILPRSPELVVALVSTMLGRRVFLGVAPDLPVERKVLMVHDAMARIAFGRLTAPSSLGPEVKRASISLDALLQCTPDMDAACARIERVQQEDPAAIFFTSGTTGRPKGILSNQRAISHFIRWQQSQFSVPRGVRVSLLSSPSFDPVLRDILLPLSVGGTVSVPPPRDHFDGEEIVRWLERAEVDIVHSVPSLFELLLRLAPPGCQLPSVKWMFSGGEPLSASLVRAWRKRFGSGSTIVNLYGPAEMTLAKTFYVVPDELNDGIQPVGRPLPNTQAFILGPSHELLDIGQTGQIALRTVVGSNGYVNNWREQARRFLKNPFSSAPRDTLYLTGDLGRYDSDGNLIVLGRCDDQLKIRGIRVEPSEVEAALEQLPGVKRSVVKSWRSTSDRPALVAFIAWEGTSLPVSELRRYLADRVHSVAVPTRFVTVKEFSLLPTGKIDRASLAPPLETRPASFGPFSELATALERELAEMWRELLGTGEIGATDDLALLGAHSLDYAHIVAKLHRSGDGRTLEALAAGHTIREMARNLEAAKAKERSRIVSSDSRSEFLASECRRYTDALPQPRARTLGGAVAPLITGATGFLGIHLVSELLNRDTERIRCVVRCDDAESGFRRLERMARLHGLWSEAWRDRVVAVPGDVTRSFLGTTSREYSDLAANTDAVFHAAARVNFAEPYESLMAANVQGTLAMLEFASVERPKDFHFVSTIDAANTAVPVSAMSGYAQSKWVAEQTVAEYRNRGGAAAIYRPSILVGGAKSATNDPRYLLWRLTKACVLARSAPDMDLMLDLVPVDHACQLIAELAAAGHDVPANLISPRLLPWTKYLGVLREAGYELELCSREEWVRNILGLVEEDPGHPMAPFAGLITASDHWLGRKEVVGSALEPTRLDYLPSAEVTEDLIRRYLAAFRQSSFLPPPSVVDEEA